MRMSLKKIILVIGLSVVSAYPANAQLVDSMDQYAEQSRGNYQPMNLSYAGFNNSLGMIQSAWQDPLQNLGEGQSKPAYSKYYWSPDLVLPIRLREAMITLVNFPEWEMVEDIYIGDNKSFAGQISGPNTILLYPQSGTNVGVDTNIIVFGRSGNKYVFYVKSEGVNTERLTNSIIDIDVVGGNGTSGGSPSSSSSLLGGSGRINANNFNVNTGKSVASTFTKRFQKEDWLKSIPLDPTKFRFDIEIYVPNPDDVVIAPERVWRDDIFTYIDLGEKALNMIQRPIVTMIVERVETPVGFRTKGPNNRLIIVEGVGDMVMRSGKRMICLKLRRSDEEGLQYVSYADDANDWDVAPAIPGSMQGNSDGNSLNSGNNMIGMPIPIMGSSDADGNAEKTSSNAVNSMYKLPDTNSSQSNSQNAEIDYSKMVRIDRSNGADLQNPYPQYKYGSAFINQGSESLSIELGTDADVSNLESLWRNLSGKYSSLLGEYEPFYSVDAPADGQGKELFHLRVGPVENLDKGDAVCSQLGRNGVFCSVVRVQ